MATSLKKRKINIQIMETAEQQLGFGLWFV